MRSTCDVSALLAVKNSPVCGAYDIDACIAAEVISLCKKHFVGIWFKIIVRLNNGNPITVSPGKPKVTCGTIACVTLINYSDSFILSCVSLKNSQRAVRGSIVDANDFKVGIRLRLHAGKALCEVLLDIVYGNNDGNKMSACIGITHADSFL